MEPKKRDNDGGRDSKGRFAAGNKGGNGRPRRDPAVTEVLASGGLRAAQYMVAVLDDPEAKAADRQRAAEYILDRLLGKAAQPILAEMHQTTGDTMTLSEMMASLRELIDA